MKVSVLIPTYNSSATIRQTLESVLRQTVSPYEVLVLDDGSTDDTVSILHSYEPKITLIQQANAGVANARNSLCARAGGDLIAFLDHDDLWHPHYLEAQSSSFERNPHAAAFFTGHVNFKGYGDYQWQPDLPADARAQEISALDFLRRYNEATGPFASMSYCCLPKRTLAGLHCQPFEFGGVDDSYLCTLLPLQGPVIYRDTPLVAYRVIQEAQSVNRLKMYALWVQVFERLEDRYGKEASRTMQEMFRSAFAARKRAYAKILMGASRTDEARKQLRESIGTCRRLGSASKSVGLFLATYMPILLQPEWTPRYRVVEGLDDENESAKRSRRLIGQRPEEQFDKQ